MNPDGSQLIYLISQPRSGSTLLQRILNMHPDIYGETEAWFMLHFVYGLRRTGIQTEYNVHNSQTGLTTFLEPLPEGTRAYLAGIRAAALSLYGRVLEEKSMSLLVDKTPRYYHIVDELKEIFPGARFILLIRNPLAVLSSMLAARERSKEGWTGLGRPDRVHDLLTAPRRIESFITKLGDEALVVRYEDLVSQPEDTIRSLCQKLNVSFFPQMLTYEGPPEHRSVIGDRWRIREHDKPVTDYVDAWKSAFSTPVRVQLAHSYFEQLGSPLLEKLGYSHHELLASLPGRPAIRYRRTWSLITTPEEELPWWRRLTLQAVRSVQTRGFWRTTLRAVFLAVGGAVTSRRERPSGKPGS